MQIIFISGLSKNELYFEHVGNASKRPNLRMEFSYGIFQLFYLLSFTCFSATFVRAFFPDVSDVLKFAHANLFLKKLPSILNLFYKICMA